MARTTLFRQLVRLARDHATATARGVDVDVVRREGGARPNGLSRRGFLGATGAAAAALALPRPARAADAGAAPRVVIVGAGISGLSAALTLADAGVTSSLRIYESSNRIGGRMFSNSPALGAPYWDDNQVTEWCGELIDSGHVTVQALAGRYGLTLDDLVASEPAKSTPVHFFGGHYYPMTQVDADFRPVFARIQSDASAAIPALKADGTPNTDGTVLWNAITPAGVALDSMSVYEWIEVNVPGGHGSNLGKLLDAAYASEYGADTTEQSSLNLVLLLSGLAGPANFAPFGASDERYHIRGGNQQLPVAIAADLQKRLGASAIQMNSVLTRVARNADGTVGLTFNVTSGGQTTAAQVVADAVILTLPFAVLADAVDYAHAGFDARKTAAIQQLGRGKCTKLQLQFSSRLWSTKGPWGIDNGEETFSDNGNQCSWEASRGQPGTSGILNGYTGGTPTMLRAQAAPVSFGKVGVGSSGGQIATLATQFLGQLEQIFPGVSALYNGKATLSIPHLDTDFLLSYAYWKAGQYQAFAGYERVPQGNIFFGGEHTSVDFQGYMEGGASEGVRAAQEVLAAIAGSALEPDAGARDAGASTPPRPTVVSSCDVAGAPGAGPVSVPSAALVVGAVASLALRRGGDRPGE